MPLLHTRGFFAYLWDTRNTRRLESQGETQKSSRDW
jgi:hypothetical protein